MEHGGEIATGTGAVAQPSAAQANDVDAMQAKLNELKNMWEILHAHTAITITKTKVLLFALRIVFASAY